MQGDGSEFELAPEPGGSDRTLMSLALINVNWQDRRATYIDNFVPYVLEVLRTAPEPLTAGSTSDALQSQFGLRIPANVVASLLNRSVKRDLATKSGPKGSAEFALTDGTAEKLPNIATQRADIQRQQTKLIRELREYARRQFGVDWNDSIAESALLTYIEAHAVPWLSSTSRGVPLVTKDEAKQGSGYIVAAFVSEILDADPELFEYLDQMVKGSMLSSALFLEVPLDVQRRFDQTTLYLDTPVCLRALGLEGDEAASATNETLKLALSQGAKLACFDHTLREMRGVLEASKAVIRRSPGGETAMRGVASHFRSEQYSENDVNLRLARLEQDLRNQRISVVETPEHSAYFTVDELELEDSLQSKVGYRYESTRLPDVKSLTAIHRLRRGSSGPHLETCRAVFITDNSGIVRASKSFFNSGRHEWPLVMLDHVLAALVWVKEPTAVPDLPRRRVIADCFSALAPSQAVWAKVSDEISRLETAGLASADNVALLRHSNEAQKAIMDVTLGDPARVSERTVQEALARARDAAAKPVTQKLANETQRAESAEAGEVAARFDHASEKARADRLENRLGRIEQRDSVRRGVLARRARRIANTVVFVPEAILGILLVASVASSLFGIVSIGPGWFAPAAAAVLVVLGALGSWNGASVASMSKACRNRFASRLERSFVRAHGLDDSD